ncbi:MAG TPA: 50S ribosomal protein L15 [Candidatus Vogelbacteria bacterium]|nr:50S ribosomal protein L15 [Candidatus Vogelbacteria bacterium]
MKIHNVKKSQATKTSRQVGRGGERGYTSGRGSKGQKSRAGHKIRPAIRDIIKKIPKKRGYRFSARSKPETVNLAVLDKIFQANDQVNPANLFKKGVIRRQSGKIRAIKILGQGNVSKPLVFSGCALSTLAEKKIIKAGGEIKV